MLVQTDDRKLTDASLPPEIRDELITILFGPVLPMAIIGMSLCVLSAMVAADSGTLAATAVALAAVLVTLFRSVVVAAFRISKAAANLRSWEIVYAVGSVGFSLVLGAFGLQTFSQPDPMAQMMAITVLVGYCAGLVARISIRPRIAVTCVVSATVPFVVAAASWRTVDYASIAAVLTALLVGSLGTIRHTYVLTVQHVMMRRKYERLAALDPLTGLPNRTMLNDRLDGLLSQSGEGRIAVNFIDLDRFKFANDTHGHAAGDAILKEVADRLRAIIGPNHFAARLGGDEFVIVLEDVASDAEAESLGEGVVASIGRPFRWNGAVIEISASIGCFVTARQGMTGAVAIARADAALYDAKHAGRARLVMFNDGALKAA